MHWRLFTLHLHFTYNYLHSTYIVLGSVSNLEMIWASLVAQMVRIRLHCGRPWFNPWDRKIPLEEGMATYSNILA